MEDSEEVEQPQKKKIKVQSSKGDGEGSETKPAHHKEKPKEDKNWKKAESSQAKRTTSQNSSKAKPKSEETTSDDGEPENPPPPAYIPGVPQHKMMVKIKKIWHSKDQLKKSGGDSDKKKKQSLSTPTPTPTPTPTLTPTPTPSPASTNTKQSHPKQSSSKQSSSKQSSSKQSNSQKAKNEEGSESADLPPPKKMEDLGKFNFSIVDLPKRRNEGKDKKEIYDKLHQYFLSSASSTEKSARDDTEKIANLTDDEISKILHDNVPNLDSLYDRTGSTPVLKFICSTYNYGLPLFNGNNAVQAHTVHAVKYIFHKLPTMVPSTRKAMFTRLAESYTACQMEQGRVIDSIYGSLTGRDKTLKEQILNLVDIQKEQVLNQIVNRYNPEAWKTTDDNPKGQIPHIQSSYCVALGPMLGLRGVNAALLDKDRFDVDKRNVAYLKKCFERLFSIEDLIKSLIADINQQKTDADRLIDRQALFNWSKDTEHNNGFDPYCIFYDEDNASLWDKDLGVPTEENQYQPFLHHGSALSILTHLFL
uniref:Uncharacterized protein n=1 Tax=Arcella intermedia TaxID=1963864 RepID=A0A6B2L1A9_9EUKA